MRSLVTGAAGFVGRHLIEHLTEAGDNVLGTDLFIPEGPNLCPIEQLDVRNFDEVAKLFSFFKPEAIYHLAGMSFVPDAESNFDAALKANVLGTNSIYRVCHLLELRSVIVCISSAEIYGKVTPNGLPITESSPIQPMNNYSLSKAMSELVAGRYESKMNEQGGGLRSVVMRPFNHIGPGQNPKFVTSAFAQQLARIAKGKVEPFVQVGNLEAQRDFSDVRDIVRGYRLAALKGSGTYILCSGKPVAIRALLEQLISVSGLKVDIVQDPERMRGPEVPVLYGSYEKAKAELGWEPKIELKDTLRDIYNYWLGRE